ncbi:hypothetical protein PINS_up004906 [Pythium insidiosum]|nr:hypothetical protein PINS_up004906 [Pythium insidiosum]
MPTLSGFLDKGPTEWSEKGLIRNMKTMRGARERWCEISHDGVLRYYKRRGDPVVRGEIDLSDASFEVVCEDLQRGNEFVLSTSSQQSHFFTKSNEELRQWVSTLRAANSFLKTSKQLDELESKMMASAAAVPEEDEQYYGRATLGF